MFKRLGAKVIDADEIAHKAIGPSGDCFKAVVKNFGRGILSDSAIDRKKLSKVAFASPQKLKKLSGIIHPSVKRTIKEEIVSYRQSWQRAVVVIDVPLLIEAGFDKLVDSIVVVKTSRREQLKRVIKRTPISQKEILNRINAQMPMKEKLKYADIIINNTGSLRQTEKQVREIWKTFLRRNNGQQ